MRPGEGGEHELQWEYDVPLCREIRYLAPPVFHCPKEGTLATLVPLAFDVAFAIVVPRYAKAISDLADERQLLSENHSCTLGRCPKQLQEPLLALVTFFARGCMCEEVRHLLLGAFVRDHV